MFNLTELVERLALKWVPEGAILRQSVTVWVYIAHGRFTGKEYRRAKVRVYQNRNSHSMVDKVSRWKNFEISTDELFSLEDEV